MNNTFSARFDAVVMLTVSDWHTEPISNRYHYATRFAKLVPVYFVQQDLSDWNYTFEPTGILNITILHLPKVADRKAQSMVAIVLHHALSSREVRKPLLWVYGLKYYDVLGKINGLLTIFHATEDYAVTYRNDASTMQSIRATILSVNGIIACSQTVLDNYQTAFGANRPACVLTNACDYGFWKLQPNEKSEICMRKSNHRMIYQGGINFRLDFSLIHDLAKRLPDWEILLCGKYRITAQQDALIQDAPNIKLTGALPIERVRALCLESDVALIPFVDEEELFNSFPLKTFEYLATGLPVVSTDILALRSYGDIIRIAAGAETFANAVLELQDRRREPGFLSLCNEYASENDYDKRFSEALSFLQEIPDDSNRKGADSVGRYACRMNRYFDRLLEDAHICGGMSKKTRRAMRRSIEPYWFLMHRFFSDMQKFLSYLQKGDMKKIAAAIRERIRAVFGVSAP